jgi:hypothetical protein
VKLRWPWVVARVVAGLILIGLIVGGGFAVYRMGWSHGYIASEGAEGAIEPALPHRGPMGPWRHGPMGYHFGAGRFLLGAGLVFLGFLFVGKLMRILFWGTWAHRHWGPWNHGHWGPMPYRRRHPRRRGRHPRARWADHCGPWGPYPGGPEDAAADADEDRAEDADESA